MGRRPSVISVQMERGISFAGLRGRLRWGVESPLYVHKKLHITFLYNLSLEMHIRL